ncbi:MAG: M81 family metallopeptidase [Methylorubrum populi]
MNFVEISRLAGSIMKIYCAGLLTETNCFVNLPTSLDTFLKGRILPGACPVDAPAVGAELMFAAKRRAAAGEFELVEGSCFRASPAGPTSTQAYEMMRGTLCEELRAALPVDAVLLGLHGGMFAYRYPDTEGDLIAHIRGVVGPDVVIGVEFDPHCIVNAQRLDNADIVVLYKEYPHTDIVEQADRLIDLVTRAVAGQFRPAVSLFDCRQVDSYPTTGPAMRRFVDKLKDIENADGKVESISLVHGFVYGDSPDLSTRLLVITNDAKDHGDALATRLGEELIALRGQTASPLLDIDAAIDQAMGASSAPVVIADPTDNAGGGAPSDNTDVLARLIERKSSNVAVGPIWDPGAVRLCVDSGVGASIPLRLGGKVASTSGVPLDCQVTVTGAQLQSWQVFGSSRVPAGESVAIRIGEIDVVLTSERTQAFSIDLFSHVGIDVQRKQAVFLKSVNHFMASFGPIASQVLYVNGGGPLQRDYAKLPYRHVRRPLWPIDERAKGSLIY